MRVSLIVVVFFRVRTRLRRIPPPPPPFPNLLLAPPAHVQWLSGRRRSHRPGSMLLFLARHVHHELSFGSSTNQPSPYCSEKRSLHLQLEKQTLLTALIGQLHLIVSAPKEARAQPQRGRRRAFLTTESTSTILIPTDRCRRWLAMFLEFYSEVTLRSYFSTGLFSIGALYT